MFSIGMSREHLSSGARLIHVVGLLSIIRHVCGKDIGQMPGFSNLDECVSAVLVSWIGDNSVACEPAASNPYKTIISNSVSFTCISAGQTPIGPQVATALDTFQAYCLDRLGDHDDSPSTEGNSPTSTAASPGSRSPGPTAAPSAGYQAASSSDDNRSLVLGCAIAIPVSVILIAGIIWWLIWRKRKAPGLAEKAQVHSKGPDFADGNAPVFEAPANIARKYEVSGQSAIKSELPGSEIYSKPDPNAPRVDSMAAGLGERSCMSTTRHELPALEKSSELEGDGDNVVPRPLIINRSGATPFADIT